MYRCLLHGYSKEVKYAFSISGPVSRMTRERVERTCRGCEKKYRKNYQENWGIIHKIKFFYRIMYKKKSMVILFRRQSKYTL